MATENLERKCKKAILKAMDNITNIKNTLKSIDMKFDLLLHYEKNQFYSSSYVPKYETGLMNNEDNNFDSD